jgi:hypothetical protein
MVVHCADDLVDAGHTVRLVMAAAEKLERLEQAIAQLPALKRRQAEAEKRTGQGKHGQKVKQRQPRVSTTDAQARVMKMPNGGFNPAVNVQLATDTGSRGPHGQVFVRGVGSRAIVGVERADAPAGVQPQPNQQLRIRRVSPGHAVPRSDRLLEARYIQLLRHCRYQPHRMVCSYQVVWTLRHPSHLPPLRPAQAHRTSSVLQLPHCPHRVVAHASLIK